MFKNYVYLPILLALVLILGFYFGTKFNFSEKTQNVFSAPIHHSDKLNEIVNYIEEEYVDTINKEELIDKTIRDILQQLDPFSYYISSKDFKTFNEPLQGNFEGIGIEFSIQKDTIVVITPIVRGPSEVAGVLAGDRIVKVNGENVAGNGITNQRVMNLLKGAKGTKVTISILRRNKKDLLDYTIIRDKIPIYSVDVAYMVNDTVGYIKLSRFAQKTYEEFVHAGIQLQNQGMKKLVLDLRGNGGGFLDVAIQLADEFLPDKAPIVYTEGRSNPKKSYYATKNGHFENYPIAVLIDEGSASASEIIAGSIQDNDRGWIIGRRSFGKGLVQEQLSWADGSAVRLTIARYYTPTGRCIQKPYDKENEDYHNQFQNDISGMDEMQIDSLYQLDSLRYTTPKGKIVYGGGGIMPDISVSVDTTGYSSYLSELNYKGIIRQFAFEYADKQRNKLKLFVSPKEFDDNFTVDSKLFDEFLNYAENNSVKRNDKDVKKSETIIKYLLKASIARNIWNDEGFYPIILKNDNMLSKALEVLK